MNKIPSEIIDIKLDSATYKGTNTHIQPTFVNFFFGNNGTGKSTIAKSIRDNIGLTYTNNHLAKDYIHLVYNQEFIDANFHSYQNMNGVFTVDEHNVTLQHYIDANNEEYNKILLNINTLHSNLKKVKNSLQEIHIDFYNKCWEMTRSFRMQFPKISFDESDKQLFAQSLLNANKPVCDMDFLKKQYNIVYGSDYHEYRYLNKLNDYIILDDVPDHEIMSVKIINLSKTDYAKFARKINATDWVHAGHEKFSYLTFGKCPYCQRELDKNFEITFSKSFDKNYTKMIIPQQKPHGY